MYSEEIKNFLSDRNYEITQEECALIMNVNENPQITHMQFFAGENVCQIDTDDGYSLRFRIKGY